MTTTVRELMMAGAHFGHRVRFWNPKMAPYIYGKYHSTHIINLDITLAHLNHAKAFVKSATRNGGKVLFLCTKKSCAESVAEIAQSVNMPYVNHRWLGGIMTNFKTTRKSIDRLISIETDIENGILKSMTKKEGIKLMLAKQNLEKTVGGIRNMDKIPDVLFVIDAGLHKGAILEAQKMGVPIVAVVDTNHSPLDIDYVIPGNDDSAEASNIYLREIAETVQEGKKEWEANVVTEITTTSGDSGKKETIEVTKKPSRVIRAKQRVKPVAEKPVEAPADTPATAQQPAEVAQDQITESASANTTSSADTTNTDSETAVAESPTPATEATAPAKTDGETDE